MFVPFASGQRQRLATLFGTNGAAKMISAEQNDSGHSQTFADWYSHNVLTEAARCQELTYFFPQHIFLHFSERFAGSKQ